MLDRDESVAGLVITRSRADPLPAPDATFLATPADLVARLFQIDLRDRLAVLEGRPERGLVDDGLELGAREAGRRLSQPRKIDVARELHVLRVNAQDLLATPDVREVERDLAVEAARPQERRVERCRDGWSPRRR